MSELMVIVKNECPKCHSKDYYDTELVTDDGYELFRCLNPECNNVFNDTEKPQIVLKPVIYSTQYYDMDTLDHIECLNFMADRLKDKKIIFTIEDVEYKGEIKKRFVYWG